MKRWLSIACAVASFWAVLAMSIFVALQVHGSATSAAAAPIKTDTAQFINTGVQTTTFEQSKKFFAERGIELSIAPSHQPPLVSWQQYDSVQNPNVAQAASELMLEYNKYSITTLKHTSLKKIYVVQDLTVDGQKRSGYPEPILDKALYFDVSDDYLQSEATMYMRRTFHHELRHFIEYAQHGSFEPTDTAWTACNAVSFTYGNGGPSMYSDPDFAHAVHPSYGFVDGYATSGMSEDKAEVFANFMTDPSGLQKLAQVDAGVACKLTQTTKLLQSL